MRWMETRYIQISRKLIHAKQRAAALTPRVHLSPAPLDPEQ